MSEAILRGRPAFAESQRAEILRLLREAGPGGVARDFLIYTKHFTQCGARIFELQKMGYVICSKKRAGQRYVTYVLESEPLSPKLLEELHKGRGAQDWYLRATGKARQSDTPEFGPLFNIARR
jgi:hypothetical protein